MSENKNVKVKIEGKFDALTSGFADLQRALAKAGKLMRSKHRRTQDAARRRKNKRRRQGKVARRARRYNRRPSKRPKGRRKP